MGERRCWEVGTGQGTEPRGQRWGQAAVAFRSPPSCRCGRSYCPTHTHLHGCWARANHCVRLSVHHARANMHMRAFVCSPPRVHSRCICTRACGRANTRAQTQVCTRARLCAVPTQSEGPRRGAAGAVNDLLTLGGAAALRDFELLLALECPPWGAQVGVPTLGSLCWGDPFELFVLGCSHGDARSGTPVLGCSCWDAHMEMLAVGCSCWSARDGMSTLEYSHWDACTGTLTLGCQLWGSHTGAFRLRCLHWDAHTGVSTLGCSSWDVHFRVLRLRCSCWDTCIGMPTLGCSHGDVCTEIPTLGCSGLGAHFGIFVLESSTSA